jgi:molybdopterin-binding protein
LEFQRSLLPILERRSMDTERLLWELARGPALKPFGPLIRPLREHDRTRRSDLVWTLKTYFAAGANASEAADRLFLHRNSMIYRLERIQWLTGLDLKDHRVALALQLGLLATERGEQDATEHLKGEAAAKVTLQVGDNHLVALITRESADELGLESGKQATALVKATDVMILTDAGDVA